MALAENARIAGIFEHPLRDASDHSPASSLQGCLALRSEIIPKNACSHFF
jgi:hypothetical protein